MNTLLAYFNHNLLIMPNVVENTILNGHMKHFARILHKQS